MEHKVIKAALDYLEKRIDRASDKVVKAISKIKLEQADINIPEPKEVDLKPVVKELEKLNKKEVVKIPDPIKPIDNSAVLREILEQIKANKPEELAEKFDELDVVFKGLKPKETMKIDDTQMRGLMAALTGGRGSVVTGGMTVEEFNTKIDELIASTNAISGTGTYTKLIDEDGTVTYIGEANIGSATSASSWRIKRVDETNDPDVNIEWASASFDQVWDNRNSLSYS